MQPTEPPSLQIIRTTIFSITFLTASQAASEKSPRTDVSGCINSVFQQVKLLSAPDNERLTLDCCSLVKHSPSQPVGSATFNSLYGSDGCELSIVHT